MANVKSIKNITASNAIYRLPANNAVSGNHYFLATQRVAFFKKKILVSLLGVPTTKIPGNFTSGFYAITIIQHYGHNTPHVYAEYMYPESIRIVSPPLGRSHNLLKKASIN